MTVLNLVASALRLPAVQFIFSTCSIIGKAKCEPIDVCVIIGLVLVVLGFVQYSVGRQSRLKKLVEVDGKAIPVVPSSFQDRVVGMGNAWRESPLALKK